VVWVWRRVCGENTLEACTIALRRHAARSKFPARPGDIADLLPAPPAPRPSGPSQSEVAAYIAEARQRVATLVEMTTPRILVGWQAVIRLLSVGDREIYNVFELDPLDYFNLHPDLQYKLVAETCNLLAIPAKMLTMMAIDAGVFEDLKRMADERGRGEPPLAMLATNPDTLGERTSKALRFEGEIEPGRWRPKPIPIEV